jgi:amino acid transporter
VTDAAAPIVPFWKVMVLGICAMAIGPNLALSAAYQLHYSGLHSWLAFLGAAVVCLLVAAAISRFARRFSVPASILSYSKLTLPRWLTAIVAATLLLGYIIGPADGVLTETIYLTSLALPLNHGDSASPLMQCVIAAFSALFIGACAYRGVDLSARIATVLGVACIPVAVWITVRAGASFGFDFRPELTLGGLSSLSLSRGVFVAMAFFIGFDGIATLASDTSEPQRNAPRLLVWILVIAGVTLSVGTLLQAPVLHEYSAGIDAGESPTRILAIAGGIPRAAAASDVVLAMAGMASLIGWFNIAALIVATASRDGFLPAVLGRRHPRYGSPHCAVIFLTLLSIVLPIAMIFWTRSAPIQSTIDLTNVMVLLWLIPYGVICAAAVRRLDAQDRPDVITALAAAGVIAVIVLVGAELLWPINRESGVVNVLGAAVIGVASFLFFKLERRGGAGSREI